MFLSHQISDATLHKSIHPMTSLRITISISYLLFFITPFLISQSKPQLSNEEWEIPTNKWILFTDESSVEDLIRPLNGKNEGLVGQLPNAYLVDFGPIGQDNDAIRNSLGGQRSNLVFEQQFARQMVKKNFNDPRLNDQWHLNNTGQKGGTVGVDANVFAAWNMGYDGTGVQICIVDDGLEKDHEDLSVNFRLGDSKDINGSGGNNPSPFPEDSHGTSCAGIAGAKGNNGIGVAGVAANVNLSGIRLIAAANTDAQEADALTFNNQNNDIYSNSWGPTDNGIYAAPGTAAKLALKEGATNGRNGLGNIFTWAAGNGRDNGDNCNYDGWVNSIYTIGVGAHADDGIVSWYSEPGASMLISAPSNGGTVGITTTTLNSDYTDDFGGTSAATPLVSGIIALMLEANPNLTWRDIQYLLIENATKIDINNADWTMNGAGKSINHNYGFGGVDAAALVAAAQNWNLVPAAISDTSAVITVNKSIPDGPAPTTYGDALTETISITKDITLEHIELKVNFTHTYRGDLRVRLTSPAGTESVLALQHSDGTDNLVDWYYMSVRHWGESAVGTWTIKVDDGYSADTGTWNDFQLIFHGVPAEDGCPTNLMVNDARITADTYVASQQITSSGIIESGSNVHFIAGKSIILAPNFTANANSTFSAVIQDCTSSFQSAPTKKRTTNKLLTSSASTLPKPTLSIYPNPTFGEATIEFTLPTTTKINLAVYNTLGQKISTLSTQKIMEQGIHQVSLSTDRWLQEGIYFILLQTGDQQISKKLYLLK